MEAQIVAGMPPQLKPVYAWARSRKKELGIALGIVLAVLLLRGAYKYRIRAARPRATQFETRVSGGRLDVPFPIKATDLLAKPYAKRIIVSEKHKLLYCPVPKVASSNWKYLIRKLEGFEDYMDLPKAHSQATSGLRYLSDYSPEEVDYLLYKSGFLKFVFVRDPYSRLLSCYVDKFANKNATKEEYRVWIGQLYEWKYVKDRDYMSDPRPSFRSFVDELLKQDPDRMNEHWMPQAYVCGFGEVPYDFVGRFETLGQDVRHVLDRLGWGEEQFPTQEDIGFLPTHASQLAGELYTLDSMLKARLLYDVDFSVLDY